MLTLLRSSDLLAVVEELMAGVGAGLKFKYGLGTDASPERVNEWARITRELIRQGYSLDLAGETAARRVFPDFKTHFYKAEADTLEMLLQQAGNK